MIDKLWNKFYLSGKVEDYIEYKENTMKGGKNFERESLRNSNEREYNERKRQSFDDTYK